VSNAATTAILVAGLLLAGCAAPSTGRTLAADEGRFRVAVPDGWQGVATNRAEWADNSTVALLATQPLDPQCSAAASAADDTGCTAPLVALRDGAMLVWWHSVTCVGAGCELPDGERLLIGGRPAVRTDGSHLCAALGATHEAAYFVTVSPQRVDAIVACERDATDVIRQQLAAMLEAVQWRTP